MEERMKNRIERLRLDFKRDKGFALVLAILVLLVSFGVEGSFLAANAEAWESEAIPDSFGDILSGNGVLNHWVTLRGDTKVFFTTPLGGQGNPETADQQGAFYYWLINDGEEVEITAYANRSGHVTIPDQIENKPVTSIGVGAFNQRDLTGVTIPDSVKNISEIAFGDNRIENLKIPDTVKKIGSGAFMSNQG